MLCSYPQFCLSWYVVIYTDNRQRNSVFITKQWILELCKSLRYKMTCNLPYKVCLGFVVLFSLCLWYEFKLKCDIVAHILLSCLTSSWTVLRLPQRQWSNSEIYVCAKLLVTQSICVWHFVYDTDWWIHIYKAIKALYNENQTSIQLYMEPDGI